MERGIWLCRRLGRFEVEVVRSQKVGIVNRESSMDNRESSIDKQPAFAKATAGTQTTNINRSSIINELFIERLD